MAVDTGAGAEGAGAAPAWQPVCPISRVATFRQHDTDSPRRRARGVIEGKIGFVIGMAPGATVIGPGVVLVMAGMGCGRAGNTVACGTVAGGGINGASPDRGGRFEMAIDVGAGSEIGNGGSIDKGNRGCVDRVPAGGRGIVDVI